MTQSKNYPADHIMAKAIICVINILLGITSIEIGNPYLPLVLGTSLWCFGINFTGYLIESLLHHPHCHNPV